MHKPTSPPSEGKSLIIKNLPIYDQPNMPACHNEHLHEEWLCKTSTSHFNNSLEIIIRHPLHLQIIPNLHTEITFEEQMNYVLITPGRTQLTMSIISDMPVPPLEQISGI
jgi:hypothetical protein